MGRGTLVKYRKWNIGEADRSAVDALRSAGYSGLLASVLAASVWCIWQGMNDPFLYFRF